MADINTVAVSGRIVSKPELRSVGADKISVTTLSVANNIWNGKAEEAHFFDVDVWGKQAESCCQYLDKGSQVMVQGDLRQNKWETDKGEKRSKVFLKARNVAFVFGEKPADGAKDNKKADTKSADPEDLPF